MFLSAALFVCPSACLLDPPALPLPSLPNQAFVFSWLVLGAFPHPLRKSRTLSQTFKPSSSYNPNPKCYAGMGQSCNSGYSVFPHLVLGVPLYPSLDMSVHVPQRGKDRGKREMEREAGECEPFLAADSSQTVVIIVKLFSAQSELCCQQQFSVFLCWTCMCWK